MLTPAQIDMILEDFPPEALKADRSRGNGNVMTSISAAYVYERLNQVFGICGIGWRYAHSTFDERVLTKRNGNESVEVMAQVALQVRCTTDNDGCGRVQWDTITNGWIIALTALVWSEPIYTVGGRSVLYGSAPNTDARKGAITDGITKAASCLGIAHKVFKGLVPPPPSNNYQNKPKNQAGPQAQKSPGAQAGAQGKPPTGSTAFWVLYNEQGAEAGIDRSIAVGIAQDSADDWDKATSTLEKLIATAI